MALSNILTQFCRRKRLNSSDGHQLHSEWDRRLGQCSLTTIVATLVLALTLHVILPAIFSHYAVGKSKMLLLSPILSLAFTSALIILAAIQLASISRRIGRNAALYQLAHGTFGQVLAVAVAWGQLLDQIAMAATVCHALSDHINLLFHNAFCSLRLPSPIWHGHDVVLLDLLAAVVLPFCAALVMMCSVRVLITSTTIFLIATMFTSASTTTVAFLHNMAQLHVFGNSEHAPETASFLSIDELFATFRCWLLAWPCVELLSFLAEECCGPRRALPTLMRAASRVQPALALLALLAFFPFIRLDTSVPLDDAAATAAASVIVHHQPLLLPLPAMFNSIRLFSARYLMNVGSVCSLWAALLCLFLAPTRLMATMATDKMIIPFGHKHLASISEKGGQPRCAVILVAFCCSLMVGVVPQQWLGRLTPLNCVLRMALQALLVYMSHFTPSSSDRFIGGDLRPKYRRVRRVRAASRAAQQQQSTEWKMCEEAATAAVDDEDEEAEEFGEGSSSISADESEDEAWLHECREREHLLERIWRLATADTAETEQHQTAHLKSIDTPLLELNNQPHQQQPPNCADYQSIQNDPPCCAPRQSSSHLPRQHGQHQRHNCFRAPCSATTMTVNGRTVHTVPLPGLHVYESEVPQGWLGAARRVESGTKAAATCDERAACDAARRALLLAFSAAAVCAAAITALRKTSDDDYLPLLPLLALLSSIVTGCAVIVWLCRLRVDYGTNQQQPLEGKWLPIGALFSMFTLIQLLPFFPPIEWALIFGWILIGLFLHALLLARSES